MAMDKNLREVVNNINSRIFTVPEGSVILKEGEVIPDMYKILSGHVELYVCYEAPGETILKILHTGECFGEFGLLLHKPSIYTAVAYSDVTLFRIVEGEMGDFVQKNHKNIIDIMRNMAATMMTMRTQINLLVDEMIESNSSEKKDLQEKAQQLLRHSSVSASGMSGKMWTWNPDK